MKGIRVDTNLVLQYMATNGEDIRDTGNGLQLIFDNPVVEFPQIGVRVFATRIYIFV